VVRGRARGRRGCEPGPAGGGRGYDGGAGAGERGRGRWAAGAGPGLDAAGDRPRAPAARRPCPSHGPPRAAGQPLRPAAGVRARAPAPPRLRRGDRARLPLARVRRLRPRPLSAGRATMAVVAETFHMTPDEFRRWGHETVDWIAGYLERIE